MTAGRPEKMAVAKHRPLQLRRSEPAVMPASVPAPVMQAVATAGPPPAVTCSRGTFSGHSSGKSGDCPTAAEKATGTTSAAVPASREAHQWQRRLRR